MINALFHSVHRLFVKSKPKSARGSPFLTPPILCPRSNPPGSATDTVCSTIHGKTKRDRNNPPAPRFSQRSNIEIGNDATQSNHKVMIDLRRPMSTYVELRRPKKHECPTPALENPRHPQLEFPARKICRNSRNSRINPCPPLSSFPFLPEFEFVLAALSRRRSGSDFGFRISGFRLGRLVATAPPDISNPRIDDKRYSRHGNPMSISLSLSVTYGNLR
jgi:hypothetical protein